MIKRTCVADCDASSEKSDGHPIVCTIHDVSGEVPVKSAVSEPQVESEVDTSVDAPNSHSSSSVNVIRDVLDGNSVSDAQKLEIIREEASSWLFIAVLPCQGQEETVTNVTTVPPVFLTSMSG